MKQLKIAIIALLLTAPASAAEPKIEAYKAPFYVNQFAMVCGVAAEVATIGKATYINLDKPYPNQYLTFVIWEENLPAVTSRLGQKVQGLTSQRLCARGKITEYKNSLQIKIKNPQYLRLMN